MAPESSAFHEISSDDEGNLELPFDWLAELLDHIDSETNEAKGRTKDGAKDATTDEAKESIAIVAADKASSTSPAVQKQNWIPSEGGKAVLRDDSDDDCLILEADPDKPLAVEDDDTNGSDDLLVVSVKGPIACRDYPHSRHLCAKFPFTSTPHEKHCDLCHCYVCDSLAPCAYWGSGISSNDHCHSNDKEEIWKIQRKIFKEDGPTTPSIQKLLDVTLSTTPTPPILEPMTLIWVPPSINVISQQASVTRSIEPIDCTAVCFERPNVMNHKCKLRPIDSRSRFAQCLDRRFTPGPLRVNRERRWCEAGNLGSQFVAAHARFKRAGSSIGSHTAINPSICGPANINQENRLQARTHIPQFLHGDHYHWKMLQEFLSSVELESGSFHGNCNSSHSSLADMQQLPAVSSQAQAYSYVPSGNYHSSSSFTEMLLPVVSSQAQEHSHVPTPQAVRLNLHESSNPVVNYPTTDLLDISLSHHPLALDPSLPSVQPSGSPAVMRADCQQLPIKPGYSELNLSSRMHDMEHQPSENSSDLPLLDLSLAWPPSTYRTQPHFHTSWEGHGRSSSCSSFLVGSQLHSGVGNIQHQL